MGAAKDMFFGQEGEGREQDEPLPDVEAEEDVTYRGPDEGAPMGPPMEGGMGGGGERPYYLDEQVGYMTIQYLLKPDIPEKYHKEFQKFLIAIDKLSALGNINREDVLRFKILFRMVIRWYKLGLAKIARQFLAEFLFEMQLSRSVDGFFTVWQSTQRQEMMQMQGGMGGGGGGSGGILGGIF